MPKPRHDRSVTRRIGAAVTVAGVMALALSGCVAVPAPTPTPTASASAEPIFASDEEALAAAEAAYGRYLEVVDQLTHDGGADQNRVNDVATSAYSHELLKSLERLRKSGNHTVGTTTYDGMRLVERTEAGGVATVSTYVCLDVTDVRVIDAAGNDVTPAERAPRSPIQAHFESSPGDSTVLLPSGSESWPGEEFC